MKFIVLAILTIIAFGGVTPGSISVAKPAYAGGGGGSEEKAEGVQFVQMTPMILPLIDGNGVSQTISLVVTLEIENPADAAHAKLYSPKLTDAYLQDMYGALNKKAAFQESGMLEVSFIKKRLNAVTAKVLGADKVNDVLLQVVDQRRI